MIRELSIKNFAIIPELSLSFHEGMTTLTGETGAGKSIIIDAMSLLCGARSSQEFVRQGAEKAYIEGYFDVPESLKFKEEMEELGIELDEEALIVQREISASGKSVCRVNARLVPLASLRKIGSFLVDIHGQNEHQELMNEAYHLQMLDDFGEEVLIAAKKNYQEHFQEYQQTLKIYRTRMKNENEFVQRMDMLRDQIEELDEAELEVGEEEKLLDERGILANVEKIASALSNAYRALEGEEESVTDKISEGMREISTIEEINIDFQKILQTLSESYYLLKDAKSEVSSQMDELEFDEDRLNEIEERLDLLKTLKRKYGETIEEVMIYHEKITQELEEAEELEGSKEELEHSLNDKKKNLLASGKNLSMLRKKIAKQLEEDILAELKSLYMEKALFSVKFTMNRDFQETGLERAEFYITSNPGEPLKPLVKVASGGEMSRIMLALKTIFSKTKGRTSIVFDEVDTGVSGRVAASIAEKIHQISIHSQVLCITHLPQVAAKSDYQYFIEKQIKNGRTQTSVQELSSEERVSEIARMLAGEEVTKAAVEHAKELLEGV